MSTISVPSAPWPSEDRSFEPPKRHQIRIPLLHMGELRIDMLLSNSVGDLASATRVQLVANDEVIMESTDGPSILQIEQGRVDEQSAWLVSLRKLVEGSEAVRALVRRARVACIPIGDAIRFSRFEIYSKACALAERTRTFDGLGTRAPRPEREDGTVYRIRRPESAEELHVYLDNRKFDRRL